MPRYKAVATVTFEFDGDQSLASATDKARQLIDATVSRPPDTADYSQFGVRVELVPLRERTSPFRRLGEYPPEQVFAWAEKGETLTLVVEDRPYRVRMSSERYALFHQNQTCVACGLVGVKFVLECRPGDDAAHFNFYATEDGRDVLMTKDHVRPRSFGGPDSPDNYTTMCAPCNEIKSAYPLSPPSVKILRDLLRNPDKLTSKELKRKFQETRLGLIDCLNGQ